MTQPQEDDLFEGVEFLKNPELRERLKKRLAEEREFLESDVAQAFLSKPIEPVIERVMRAGRPRPVEMLGRVKDVPAVLAELGRRLGAKFEVASDVLNEHLFAHINRLGEPVGAAAVTRSRGAGAETTAAERPELAPISVRVHGVEGVGEVPLEVLEPLRLEPISANDATLSGHYRTAQPLPAGEWYWAVRFSRLDRPGDAERSFVCAGHQAPEGGVVEWRPNERVSFVDEPERLELDARELGYELVRRGE